VNKSGDAGTLIIVMEAGGAWKDDVPIDYPPLHHPLPDTKLLPDELTFTLPVHRDCNVHRNVWIVHSSPGIILKADPWRRSSAAKA